MSKLMLFHVISSLISLMTYMSSTDSQNFNFHAACTSQMNMVPLYCDDFASMNSLTTWRKCISFFRKSCATIQVDKLNFTGLQRLQCKEICRKILHRTHKKRRRRESQIKNHQVPLPKELEKEINKQLRKMHHSLSKKEGTSLEFKCETQTTIKIIRAFPRASYRWIRNDLPLKIEADRMVYQMGTLIIQGLKPTDTGLYLCQVEYEKKQIKTVAIYSVVVESENRDAVEVRETETLKLQCNSGPLGHFYPEANRTWWIGDKVFKKDIPAKLTKPDEFPNAQKNMNGSWTCTVSHQLSNRMWTTALYSVRVVEGPSIWENYWEKILENKIYCIAVILGIFSFFAVMCITAIRQSDKLKTKENQDVEYVKQQLLQHQEEEEMMYDQYAEGQMHDDDLYYEGGNHHGTENGNDQHHEENYVYDEHGNVKDGTGHEIYGEGDNAYNDQNVQNGGNYDYDGEYPADDNYHDVAGEGDDYKQETKDNYYYDDNEKYEDIYYR